MPEDRDNKRRERYLELRALGFSVQDARRYRDQSGKNIELRISKEQRRISRKPEQIRSSEESFKLSRIRQRRQSANFIARKARMSTRQERWQEFSDFSKSGAWPQEIRARIRAINTRAGLDSDDGYGFRRYYYEFVERLNTDESKELSERNDSGMRYLLNRSLVRGRSNLRRLLNPPKSQSRTA